jgi:predicted HicB family RNase H-like nuclease
VFTATLQYSYAAFMKRQNQERQKMKTITVRLPEVVVRAAKVHAAKTGTQLRAIVETALATYLKTTSRKEGV